MGTPYVGDEGGIIQVTLTSNGTPIDINDATTMELRFRKKDNSTVVKDADFVHDGSNGEIQYVVEAGFYDQHGTWEIQAYVEGPGYKYSSEVKDFPVLANIV
ncbi:MAG: BppU family phage baseplate upper protein [bacterium]|nr:BppU family phage baseplate upper protein [bacterium]